MDLIFVGLGVYFACVTAIVLVVFADLVAGRLGGSSEEGDYRG